MSADEQALVAELSRELVSEVAPEELDLFDDLAGEYLANPNPPHATRGPGDDALGFGMGEALSAVTPAAMAALSVMIPLVTNMALDLFKSEGADFIRQMVKEKLSGKKPVGFNLTPAQLQKARELAFAEAKRFGLKKAEADRLADALAGRLAMGQ
jgi:hypothetical protein